MRTSEIFQDIKLRKLGIVDGFNQYLYYSTGHPNVFIDENFEVSINNGTKLHLNWFSPVAIILNTGVHSCLVKFNIPNFAGEYFIFPITFEALLKFYDKKVLRKAVKNKFIMQFNTEFAETIGLRQSIDFTLIPIMLYSTDKSRKELGGVHKITRELGISVSDKYQVMTEIEKGIYSINLFILPWTHDESPYKSLANWIKAIMIYSLISYRPAFGFYGGKYYSLTSDLILANIEEVRAVLQLQTI